jgi:two-component system NtrC family response regulator
MILIIDDDIGIRTSLNLLLKQAGLAAFAVPEQNSAIKWLRENSPDLILMDMNFTVSTSGQEGLELLRKVKILHPEVPVILITGWGTISLAVEGVKLGASDFITKPWDNNQIVESVRTNIKIAEINNYGEDISDTKCDLRKRYNLTNIVGNSTEIKEVLTSAMRIAPTNATVLITGESGTGKELIAEAIHNNSKRKDKPFIKVNLGGLSSSLFERDVWS